MSRTARRTAYYTTMDRTEIDLRIQKLWTKHSRVLDGAKRAELRAEVDALLEERHRRWPAQAA
jgi:hypothetical protein